MADVRLFCGLRYDARRVALRDVVCPPYDVISAAEARVYRANSPYNAVHLDMPLGDDESAGEDRYAQAAAKFVQWQREGILVRDESPSLYVLEQEFHGPDGVPRKRRGFVGRLHLEEAASGVVLPHEHTNPGPSRLRKKSPSAESDCGLSSARGCRGGILPGRQGRWSAILARLLQLGDGSASKFRKRTRL